MEDRELLKRIDARRFPRIEGLLDTIETSGDGATYRVSGDVVFLGISRAHAGLMTIRALDDETIEMVGGSTFDVREFGMEPPRILMLKVDPEVHVRVEIVAVKEK
jgi:hypothetical protein